MKPVELQIAVPRTSEAGRIQQEQQMRPTVDQQQLAAQNIKSSEQQRIRSSEVDEPFKSEVRDGEKHSSGKHGGTGGHQHESEDPAKQTHPAEHPYKGKHIDFSL